MSDIVIYSTRYCGFCNQAKMLLKRKGLEFQDIAVDGDPELRAKISEKAGGFRTVPMIFIDQKFIGGYTELASLERDGKLP